MLSIYKWISPFKFIHSLAKPKNLNSVQIQELADFFFFLPFVPILQQ